MIKDDYGGSVCYHAFMLREEMTKRRMTKPKLNAAKPQPHRRRRLELLSQRQKKRTRWIANVAERLARGEAGPNQSLWVRSNVQRCQEQAREASASSQAVVEAVQWVEGDGVSAALSIPRPWVYLE